MYGAFRVDRQLNEDLILICLNYDIKSFSVLLGDAYLKFGDQRRKVIVYYLLWRSKIEAVNNLLR